MKKITSTCIDAKTYQEFDGTQKIPNPVLVVEVDRLMIRTYSNLACNLKK